MNKTAKHLLSLLVIIILLMSLNACHKSENNINEVSDITSTPTVTQSAKPKYYPEPENGPRPYGYTSGSYEEYSAPTPIPEEDIVYLNLSEDEILNMSDEDLWYYADLQAKDMIGNPFTYKDNTLETVYEDIKKITGFNYTDIMYIAESSATDYDDALKIAENEFKTSNPKGCYDNITYIGEYDDFYVFSASYYYDNKFCQKDCRIIFKKDFFDVDTKTLKCELNKDNILNFIMIYKYLNFNCIGFSFTETDKGYSCRVYSIYCSQGDWNLCDTACLEREEYNISRDGILTVPNPSYENFIRESEIPYRLNTQPYFD